MPSLFFLSVLYSLCRQLMSLLVHFSHTTASRLNPFWRVMSKIKLLPMPVSHMLQGHLCLSSTLSRSNIFKKLTVDSWNFFYRCMTANACVRKLFINMNDANSSIICCFVSQWSTCFDCFNCLLMSKIREMASDVLRLYFSWPLPSALLKQPSADAGTACQLLDTALRHCNCTRPRECDSGALLCTVIFAGLVSQRALLSSVWTLLSVQR